MSARPMNEALLTGGAAQGSEGQAQNDTPSIHQPDGDHKELARLTAHAARGGFVVHELASGGYLLGKWGHCRELPSLHALSIALRQMGVGNA